MGNYISKCCGQDGRKYKKKKENIKATQPEQDDPNAKVATNAGATKEIPNSSEPTITPEAKEDEEIPKDKKGEKKGEKKDEKKPRSKHKRRKHSETSEDSTSSSSETSDSSDSDVGHKKSSRKVYKKKGGGTTIISKKTIIGGNKMTIGKHAKNLTINIGSNTSTPTVNKSTPPPKEKKRKLFTQEYTNDEAKVEEQRLYSLFRGKAPGNGQFIDLRGHENVQTVFHTGVLFDCAEWVGQIVFPNGTCTCFRVGTKYIMTALHALKVILKNSVEYQPVQETENDEASANLHRLSEHDIFVDFKHLIAGQNTPERNKFHFKHIQREEDIPFIDTATDTVVLELQEEPNKPFPLQFTNFGIPMLDKPFHLITHSNGNPKEFDKVCKMQDLNHTQTVKDINFLKSESEKFLGANNLSTVRHRCEIQPYDTLANHSRLLFNCSSTKGASGSPGVQVTSSGRVIVVTMLLYGYPSWYYDSECEHIRADWPKEYTIEQGVNFSFVYLTMKNKDAALCDEIFPPTNEPRGPNIHTINAVPPTDAN